MFDNINVKIPDSGIFAICGASGSGKTTLMRIILGLEQPDSGNISGLEGKKAAVVFQNDRLLPWLSALDNVAAVCSKERADILLLDEPFKGLDTELRGRIVKLVEDFAKTKPVILITHDPWEVSLVKAKLDIEK